MKKLLGLLLAILMLTSCSAPAITPAATVEPTPYVDIAIYHDLKLLPVNPDETLKFKKEYGEKIDPAIGRVLLSDIASMIASYVYIQNNAEIIDGVRFTKPVTPDKSALGWTYYGKISLTDEQEQTALHDDGILGLLYLDYFLLDSRFVSLSMTDISNRSKLSDAQKNLGDASVSDIDAEMQTAYDQIDAQLIKTLDYFEWGETYGDLEEKAKQEAEAKEIELQRMQEEYLDIIAQTAPISIDNYSEDVKTFIQLNGQLLVLEIAEASGSQEKIEIEALHESLGYLKAMFLGVIKMDTAKLGSKYEDMHGRFIDYCNLCIEVCDYLHETLVVTKKEYDQDKLNNYIKLMTAAVQGLNDEWVS